MIAVSDDFKTAMKEPMKEIKGYMTTGEITIADEDDLISFKISCDSGMCKTAMRKLEASYIGETNLLGEWVHPVFGVKTESGNYEYLDYGSFLITEISYTKDGGTTSVVGYDKMINAMTEYEVLDIEYPMTLYDYTKVLCEACGLELGTTSDEMVNGDWEITGELWENIDGITYRDILVQIAQATASTCIISNDDNVYFKYLTDTGEQLTYDNMKSWTLDDKYGEINSVVLSRSATEDNIYIQDEDSIAENGLTEYRIEDNEIVDKDRDSAITPIFNTLNGIYYYPFTTTTEGLGWYEIGDSFNIVDNDENSFYTSLFYYSITIDGSIKETLKTTAETKTQTQYQYATTVSKRLKNTEIIVNKQDQYIQQLVSDMYEEDGIVNENYTELYQDIENITASVQNTGGSNLITNSVMFAYDSDGTPNDWEVEGDGSLTIQSDAESLTAGALSGHSFTLLDKTVRQTIYIKADSSSTSEDEKTYYTFSCKIKKYSTGTCYVKIYNDNEEYIIELGNGESSFYGDYELKSLLPTLNYYIIEFYGSSDSGATFTDNMFNIGTYKSQWSQASGEIMNTQVNINVDGIVVKSSIYSGDYTIMSPLEFAGYSNINGTLTKVFSLNKDTTSVKKLESEDEVKMPPIKIVPITEGDWQGWAFVPSS